MINPLGKGGAATFLCSPSPTLGSAGGAGSPRQPAFGQGRSKAGVERPQPPRQPDLFPSPAPWQSALQFVCPIERGESLLRSGEANVFTDFFIISLATYGRRPPERDGRDAGLLEHVPAQGSHTGCACPVRVHAGWKRCRALLS